MDLLTVREAAEWLHADRNYVYRLINAKMLPSMKIGSLKIREQALDDFLSQHEGYDVDKLLKERESNDKESKE